MLQRIRLPAQAKLLLVRSLALLAALCALPGQVMAEGSRNLYPANYEASYPDEGRGNLDLQGTSTIYLGVAARRTFLYVYAEAGEYILSGSRNRTSAGVGAIRIYDPQDFGQRGLETIPASADFICDAGTTGLIDTRARELAGPRSVDGSGNLGGYAPCVYQVPETGIYGVLFGVGASGGNPDAVVDPPATSTNTVAAWDVTVRSADTASIDDLDGRVFTYAWSVYTADNGVGHRLYSDLYYVTLDGYRYRQRMTGIDPNGGTFFANTLGFLDNGEPLYKDIRGSNQAVSGGIPPGVSVQRPEFPIFFSDITDADSEIDLTLSVLGIPTVPLPPQVNGFRFVYPPTGGATAYVGQGGTFEFEVTDTISFEIVLSRDGVDFDPANPQNRVITGQSDTGTYEVVWDGKDNAGNNFPVGEDFQFRIIGRNGEVHFPFVDVEGNLRGGPILNKLNGNIQDALVYYDDRGYVTSGGTTVGTLNGSLCGDPALDEPVPNVSLLGVDSSDANLDGSGNYYRAWDQQGNPNSDCDNASQGFGDTKGLNLWTYQITLPQSSTLDIIDAADVTAIVDAPAVADAGSQVLVSVSFGNVGSQNAADVGYTIQLPAGLSGVNCTGATCTYDVASGAVAITGLPGSLSPAQFAPIGLRYTAPASGSVVVEASVSTSTDQGPNLAPDSAAGVTLIGGSMEADVLATVDAPATAVAGGTVSVVVGFRNIGASSAADVSYSLSLPAALNGVSCVGATCGYNPVTGEVTLSGLPGSLAPGATVPSFTLQYTAPAAGTVLAEAAISTSSTEINLANNTASDATSVLGAAGAVDIAAAVDAPTSAQPGSAVSVAVRFQNVGSDPLAGAGYSLQLPAGLVGVSCQSPALCSYASGSGVVSISGLASALGVGEQTGLSLQYTAPLSGVVVVEAIASVAGDADPDNDRASDSTTIVTAASGVDVTAQVNPPATAAPGATVNVPVQFANLGPAAAAGVVYSLQLPSGLSGVSCSGGGVSCSYDSGSGALSVSGAPGSLASGESLGFSLVYTAPASGTVAVTASISTSSPEANLGNNSDSGQTEIAAASTADVTTSVAPPPSAAGGSTVSVPVSYANVGAITASDVGYRLELSNSPGDIAVTYFGTPCSYDSGSGAISGCALPTSLLPGQTIALELSYTAPFGPLSVQVDSTVSTSTTQSNTANDTASAATAIPVRVIDAVDDDFTGTPVSGFIGGSTASVFGNDTLDAVPFLPAAVVPSLLDADGITGLQLNADGSLDVPAGTPAGDYTISYRICEAGNPGNCDQAEVELRVVPPAIDAVDDDFSGAPFNAGSGGLTASVFGNDTLGGSAFASAAVLPTLIDNDGLTGVQLNADGTLQVPAGATPGDYTLSYRICEALNPANCDQAFVQLRLVADGQPIARDDVASTPVDTPVTVPVLINDDFGDDGPGTLAISIVTPPPVGTATVDDGGTPNDPSDDRIRYVPPIGYEGPPVTLSYRICDADGDCDDAVLTVTVGTPCAGTGTVSGVIFLDANRDTLRQGGEAGERSLVSLVPASGAARITASDASGNYVFSDVPAGSYRVEVLDSYLANVRGLYATGATARPVSVVACADSTADFGYAPPAAGVVGDFVWYDINQSGRVDEFFDADGNGQLTLNDPASGLDESQFEWVDLNGDGQPGDGEFARCGLRGVTVELLGAGGAVVATTQSNARGAYRFLDLPLGQSYTTRVREDAALQAAAQAYQLSGRCLSQLPVPGKLSAPALSGKGVVGCGMTTATTRSSPQLSGAAPVYDALDFGNVCAGVIGADLGVQKTVSPAVAAPGDELQFTLTVTNFGPAVASNVVVTDAVPAGYSVLGTTVSAGSFLAPEWRIDTLAVGASQTLNMRVRVNPSGPYLNLASARADQPDPNPPNDEDSATPTVSASGPATIPVDAGWATLLMLFGVLALAAQAAARRR